LTIHRDQVRGASIRVAFGAAAVVAVIYLVVGVAVIIIATGSLTSQIDARLAGVLPRIASDPFQARGGFPSGPRRDDRPDQQLGPILLAWRIAADGTVLADDPDFPLPAEYQNVTGPQTVVIRNTPVRIQGMALGDRYIVVGQSTTNVEQTASTILLAEVIIAPILLLVVFLGAVAIGRRVALPIELARQRQMEFTADASHELRTPLSVIEAHTSLALVQDRNVEWYRRAFGKIDVESKRIRRLLDDLLWLARFDATRGQPNAEPVDVAVMAAQTVDRFGVVAEARHLGLTVATNGESQVIVAPPDWLDRLLGVLLDNACKYAPDGGTVRVSVDIDRDRVRLTVDDSGPGIPVDERARIFDRFHRATETGGGAGLGLAIADAIVKSTGGRWKIDASPLGGASMSVSWPRALAGSREPAARRTPARLPSD
jgi:signal transduction histidine kinase